jgi:hypothetical protein
MWRIIRSIIIFILGLVIGAAYYGSDNDSQPEYDDIWLPENCCTILRENMAWYQAWTYTPEYVLGSIDRNCNATYPYFE